MVAESMTMISTGHRAAKARLAALFPDAVGPVKHTTGNGSVMTSLAPHEHAVEFAHRPLEPGRPAVIALIGAFRTLHLAQQRIHFVECQAPVGPYRAMARHGGKQFIAL